MKTPLPEIHNEPIETTIRGLRLLATTTGLPTEGETLMRQLVNLDGDLLRQLAALTPARAKSRELRAESLLQQKLAALEARLDEPMQTPLAMARFLAA